MESQTFLEGDIVLRSVDGDLFHIQESHIPVACQTFPSYLLNTHHIVDTTLDASVLKIVLHFIYPSKAPPNLNGISIDILAEVFSLTKQWGMPLAKEYCRFHFQQHVAEHYVAVLRVVEDCTPLLASLVPFIIDLRSDTLMDMGVSHRLCTRWANFREQCIFAMIKAENVLDIHDGCPLWRNTVKPHLKNQVRDGQGQLKILLVKKPINSDSLSVQDVFQLTLKKLTNVNNLRSFSGSYIIEVGDNEMAQEMGNMDEDFCFGANPAKPNVSCCKTHLYEWHNAVIAELNQVQF
ncbi:hypothetical protein BT96DRAFT_1005012 [Gymnopus androsaceus JB14]|uniref:BTB domain-containing protein n=1 Tax=Gymnopus androsaceus JB14 TaxID=1447944 RepID=A0A6A4GP40_9AGAR|nr:hypothetical protein BT96DRAFT_1005012 [Gymnopus androsaceus JB14]